MRTTTFSIQIQVKAMNEASAKKKLKQWLEPSLALKKNSDITAKNLTVVGSDAVGSTAKKTSSAPKRKSEPEYDEDYDEEFDDLDWESLDEEDEEDEIEEDEDDDWDDDEDDWSEWDEDTDSDDKEAEKEESKDEEKEEKDEDDDLDDLLDFDDDDW
tara:strand:- start:1321 stop:1791 length:471 start_codon:yes stop_codon:yes gene_type:complete